MRRIDVWVVGLGTVGRWLLRRLGPEGDAPLSRHGLAARVVGAGNARDGFVHRSDGLDTGLLLELLDAGRPISEHPGAERWGDSLDGLAATRADVLAEVSASPRSDGEPGAAHMREALGRGIPVVTSNKWPVALHGVELSELAATQGTAFRAESTVMSGTPVLSTLSDGVAGATVTAVRGVLSATVNFILSRMAEGDRYDEALARAQRAGLAERDPAADVDGHDETAKAMILAGLVFGSQLRPGDVACTSLGELDPGEVEAVAGGGARLRSVTSIERGTDGASLTARVRPEGLQRDDPLWGVDGRENAVVCSADPIGKVTVTGPGAGPALAGQGVLSDLIVVATRGRA
jgi:homoserine dehydrogenase